MNEKNEHVSRLKLKTWWRTQTADTMGIRRADTHKDSKQTEVRHKSRLKSGLTMKDEVGRTRKRVMGSITQR